MAATLVILGVIAMVFWPGEEKGELRLTVTSLASNRLSITITNTFPTSIQYNLIARHRVGSYDVSSPMNSGEIMGYSATNHASTNLSAGSWRMSLLYLKPSSRSFVALTRENLSDVANDCSLPRLSAWLEPKSEWKIAPSPDMLGNKPVKPEQK